LLPSVSLSCFVLAGMTPFSFKLILTYWFSAYFDESPLYRSKLAKIS